MTARTKLAANLSYLAIVAGANSSQAPVHIFATRGRLSLDPATLAQRNLPGTQDDRLARFGIFVAGFRGAAELDLVGIHDVQYEHLMSAVTEETKRGEGERRRVWRPAGKSRDPRRRNVGKCGLPSRRGNGCIRQHSRHQSYQTALCA